MKTRKTAGPSCAFVELFVASGKVWIHLMIDLFQRVLNR